MRALVTGGAGFIGSNLVKLLTEERHDLVVLDNCSSGYRENLAPFPRARIVEGDVRDEGALRDAAAGCEVIFHLAASVGNARSIEHPIEDSEVNVLGTLRVLEAARHHGVRKVVFSSAAGGIDITVEHGPPRKGDVRHSLADVSAARAAFGFDPDVPLEAGLREYMTWAHGALV